MCFFFNDTATTEIYTLSLHDALPISALAREGTQFWVVKVEFGLAAIGNLGTLVTGDYIEIGRAHV